ncbi:MAG TPA: response regulator [Anaerolineales bacterium]|nr:response regulator [Anaerolineales bacterium]
MKNPEFPILVIEDEPNLLELIRFTLDYKGYQVVTAQDGEEGLDKVFEFNPALVITDIMMPRMDGFTFLHKLRTSAPNFANIPVILLTATYVSSDDKDFAMNLGATRFITKPVDLSEFLQNIEEILSKINHLPTSPLEPLDFYKRYQDRLEAKLSDKNAQIARFQLLTNRVSEPQNSSYQNLLNSALTEKANIVNELADVKTILQNLSKQE